MAKVMSAVNHWLVKSEPETYGWSELTEDAVGMWDGVRNVEARKHLRQMAVGDSVLFYHSGKTREIVGIAEVTKEGYPDPTAERPIWTAVNLKAVQPLTRPVTLKELKADASFAECALVRRARLSVMPISSEHYATILRLSNTP